MYKHTVMRLLDLYSVLVHSLNQTISCLMMMTNPHDGALHCLFIIFKYILFLGLINKSLSGIFSHCTVATSLPLALVDGHCLLSVRDGGDTSLLLSPLRTRSLAAHASVIMAVSHITGWQRLTVRLMVLKAQMGSIPLGHRAEFKFKGSPNFFLFSYELLLLIQLIWICKVGLLYFFHTWISL